MKKPALSFSKNPWFIVSVLITILLLILILWNLYYSYNTVKDFKNSILVIERTSGEILYHAKSLEMAVKTGSAIGDLSWQSTYDHHFSELSNKLDKILNLMDCEIIGSEVINLKTILSELNQIELKAFKEIGTGNKEEALKMLRGWEYVRNSIALRETRENLTIAVQNNLQERLDFTRKQILFYLILVFISILILILSWSISVKAWRMNLKQRAEKELEIIERNKELENSRTLIQQHRNHLRLIIDTLPNHIFLKTIEGRYLLINKALADFFGIDPKMIIGKTDLELEDNAENDKRERELDIKLIEQGTSIFIPEEKKLKKDGSFGWFQTIKIPYKHPNSEEYTILGISTEITEIKTYQESLKEAKLSAESANKAKSIFIANMSHEIRTPLNSVIGFSDLLKNTEMDNIQLKYLDNIGISARSLLDIINDILDYSKIEAGKMELDLIMDDIIELVNSTAEILKPAVRKKNLKFILNIDPDMPNIARIDPVRLRQILLNLLGNGIKFTKKGKVEMKVSFSKIDEKYGIYSFSIIDTGIGITKEQQKRLFQAFSQADSSTTRRFGGTGLGLVISNNLVRKMGGHIELNSIPETGSTFSFKIRTEYRYQKKKTEKKDIISDKPTKISGSYRVLIAEDVSLNMMLIVSLIENIFSSAEIFKAQNGKEAVEIFQKNSIDIVFMDIQMPVMNGIDASIKIRELEKGQNTPIIALSAGVSPEQEKLYKDAGIDYFLSKPIDQDNLKLILYKILVIKADSE